MNESTFRPFEAISEDWQRALVVVAHPDDVEFGAAAAIARWTDQGKTISYCMVTSGEAGINGLHPDECRIVREAEQVASARIVGVDTVEFLGFPDGTVEYGLPLRQAIAQRIRHYQPEILIIGNHRDTFGGSMPNQADHIASGRAAIDAVRDAGNRWIFPEQLSSSLEPWDGIREIWVAGSPEAQHAVDTTATFERGVESLKAHRAYIDGLGWDHFDPAEMLEGFARPAGTRLGTTFAAPFEVISMVWGE